MGSSASAIRKECEALDTTALMECLGSKGLLDNVDSARKLIICRQLMFEHSAKQAEGASDEEIAAHMATVLDEKTKIATIGVDGDFSCPKVRFGRTELQMPVVTCGGMRMQRAWGNKVQSLEEIESECAENFISIIRRSLQLGINHFETARGYGCSELQYGDALKTLISSGEVKREDVIIQTKVPAKKTAAEFRKALETSWDLLGLDYIDLFAFHGLNRDFHIDWILNNGEDGNCMDVIQEYVQAGKIRHVGFSTHAQADVITKAIETGKFDYVNLHYQFVGSYTASGGGDLCENSNLSAVQAAQKQDMGVFIISPFDKGGMLYKPSAKLYKLCQPDLTPIALECLWSWHHEQLNGSPLHTLVVGASRPSDFDEAATAAQMFAAGDKGRAKLDAVMARCKQATDEAIGADWAANWHKKLPTCFETENGTAFSNIVWYHNIIKAYGLVDFCTERYNNLKGNRKKWIDGDSYEKNMEAQGWGYGPGLAFKPGQEEEITKVLTECGCDDVAKIVEIITWTHGVLTGAIAKQQDWAPAFDMQPDRPWAERQLRPASDIAN